MADINNRLRKTIGSLMNTKLRKKDRVKKTSRLFGECLRHFVNDVGVNPVCGPKCISCCLRMPFIRSGTEEDYIHAVLDDLGLNVQKEIVPKIPGNLRAWRDLCASHGQNHARIVHQLDIQKDWLETGNQCPLLDDGLCSIHPRIPLDCKMTLKANTICLAPTECDFAGGMHGEVITLCHKIDRKLEKKPYRDIPLIEVLHLWATR